MPNWMNFRGMGGHLFMKNLFAHFPLYTEVTFDCETVPKHAEVYCWFKNDPLPLVGVWLQPVQLISQKKWWQITKYKIRSGLDPKISGQDLTPAPPGPMFSLAWSQSPLGLMLALFTEGQVMISILLFCTGFQNYCKSVFLSLISFFNPAHAQVFKYGLSNVLKMETPCLQRGLQYCSCHCSPS